MGKLYYEMIQIQSKEAQLFVSLITDSNAEKVSGRYEALVKGDEFEQSLSSPWISSIYCK